MATLKEDSSAWKCTSIISRDHRHDKGDGYEDTPHKSKHGKKTRPRKKAGCPGNDGKNHVYVWIGARYTPAPNGRYFDNVREKWFYPDSPNYDRTFHGWNPWKSRAEHIAWLEAREIQICAGCYKKSGKKRKLSGEPVTSWWFSY